MPNDGLLSGLPAATGIGPVAIGPTADSQAPALAQTSLFAAAASPSVVSPIAVGAPPVLAAPMGPAVSGLVADSGPHALAQIHLSAAAAPASVASPTVLGALPALAAASAPLGFSSREFGALDTKADQPALSPRQVLVSHLMRLEDWAMANQKDADRDTWTFWSLKIPAILASATAGIWAHFNWTAASIFVGAAAGACIAIDGIYPRGTLRNIHLRAVHDIRNLSAHMLAQFDSAAGNQAAVVRKIVRESERERRRIAAYVRDADTALKTGGKVRN